MRAVRSAAGGAGARRSNTGSDVALPWRLAGERPVMVRQMLAHGGYASPVPRPAPTTQPYRAGIALIVIAIVIACDGAWFVARTAETGLPTFLHGRVLGWLVQAPALIVRPLVGDPSVLSIVLGLCFGAVPNVALLASWRIVRPDRLDLMAFPVIGIGLGLLPG